MKKTDKNPEWFADENFWEHFAPVIFNEERMAETPSAVEGIIRLACLNQKGRKPERGNLSILDICCGPGRIAIELCRRGFSVTGVDLSKHYLAVAESKAGGEGSGIEFIQKDARKFRRREAFDAVINIYNSFGYFESENDDLALLKNAYYSLKQGGAIIIDVLGKEIAVRDYSEAEWFEHGDYTFLTESKPLDSWSSIQNRWILIQNGNRFEKTYTQRLYSASELRSLLRKAHFSAVEIYGGWDESPYDENAKTMITIAWKA